MRTSFSSFILFSKIYLAGLTFAGWEHIGYSDEFSTDLKPQLTFVYEESRPRIVNGVPVYGKRYWVCVERLVISFRVAPVMSTVFGNIVLVEPGTGLSQSLSVTESTDFGKKLTLQTAGRESCNDWDPVLAIEIGKDLRFANGNIVGTKKRMLIPLPSSSDQMPNPARKTLPLHVVATELEMQAEDSDLGELDERSLEERLALSVQPAAINEGFKA